jgi:hypothetical protein
MTLEIILLIPATVETTSPVMYILGGAEVLLVSIHLLFSHFLKLITFTL